MFSSPVLETIFAVVRETDQQRHSDDIGDCANTGLPKMWEFMGAGTGRNASDGPSVCSIMRTVLCNCY